MLAYSYYGESLPFGNDTYSKVENLQFLTSEQALADYAVFLTWLKQQYNATDVAVITFGGSYGGMLSAWFRMKYPNIVAGAIAASAPIWQFTGLVDPHTYSAITTRTFRAANESCPAAILKSWDAIQRMPLDQLSTIMRLCTPLKAGDVESLLFPWLSNAYQYTAMVGLTLLLMCSTVVTLCQLRAQLCISPLLACRILLCRVTILILPLSSVRCPLIL